MNFKLLQTGCPIAYGTLMKIVRGPIVRGPHGSCSSPNHCALRHWSKTPYLVKIGAIKSDKELQLTNNLEPFCNVPSAVDSIKDKINSFGGVGGGELIHSRVSRSHGCMFIGLPV